MEPDTNVGEPKTAAGHLMQHLLRKVALLERQKAELELELELERRESGSLRQRLAAGH